MFFVGPYDTPGVSHVGIHIGNSMMLYCDRGFQYTSKVFKDKLDKQKMTQRMSQEGRCIDNSPMEGFWGILKYETYYLNHFETYEELAAAIE